MSLSKSSLFLTEHIPSKEAQIPFQRLRLSFQDYLREVVSVCLKLPVDVNMTGPRDLQDDDAGGKIRPDWKGKKLCSFLPVLIFSLRAGVAVCTKLKYSPEASSIPSSNCFPAS